MSIFRKKPVEVEAVQFRRFFGMGALEFGEPTPQWITDAISKDYGKTGTIRGAGSTPQLIIETLEGEMRADPGDWIVKGVKGELYPVKPDIFEATYDKVHQIGATTFEPLSPGMSALFDQGRDITIYDWTNCAPGTIAWDVNGLVRRGLWEEKRRHLADDPMARYVVYGPAAQAIDARSGETEGLDPKGSTRRAKARSVRMRPNLPTSQ